MNCRPFPSFLTTDNMVSPVWQKVYKVLKLMTNKGRLSHLGIAPEMRHLTAARMATLMHEATSDQAIAFRDEVLSLLYYSKAKLDRREGKRVRRPQSKERLAHCLTLDAILADLILATDNTNALGFCYRSSNRQGFTDSATKATSKVYDWQIDALEATGLIDRKGGYAANEDFDGAKIVHHRRATRLRATWALMEIAQRHGIDHSSLYSHYAKLKQEPKATIVLKTSSTRTGRGRVMRCPDNERTAELRRPIDAINDAYAQNRFEGTPSPVLRRVFNCADTNGFDFNKGGRLIADFQDMPRESRASILIDGRAVVELDLKASQLTILYGITKTPMREGDPYQIDGVPRSVVKAVVTTMIGLGHTNLTRWPSETRKGLLADLGDNGPMSSKAFGKLYAAKTMAAKVLKAHPVLHHLSPDKLDWADLQFIESEVMVAVIHELTVHCDIPALPIHDSIIVPKGDEAFARQSLAGWFAQIAGRKPIIEAKT